jgi:hypothetical protein
MTEGIWLDSQQRQEIFSSPKHPEKLWSATGSLFSGYQDLFPRVKHPGCGANHLPPSNAEVKNWWNHTIATICHHGMVPN